MRRAIAKSRVDDGHTRHSVRIEGEDCAQNTHEARVLQHQMLEMLAQDVSMLACGHAPFQKMTMRHDGERWVVEAEALADEALPPLGAAHAQQS